MREIAAFYVSPIHGSPFYAVRMILKEYMIFVVVDDKTVGIVNPTLLARNMKFR